MQLPARPAVVLRLGLLWQACWPDRLCSQRADGAGDGDRERRSERERETKEPMEAPQAAAAVAEPPAKPAQAESPAGSETVTESPVSSPTSSPTAGGALETKAQDYNKTSGISETVQRQMDQGVDPAAASALEYANYLSGQRNEGYGATAAARFAWALALTARSWH